MMRGSIFVTGANGFIGRAIMDRHAREGGEARGVDIHADPARGVIAGDVANPADWSGHARGCDILVHCAAIVSMGATWDEYRRVTVQGTRNAVEVARDAGCRRLIHISSIAAGGWQLTDAADENSPVWVGEEYRYGAAKAASEHVVLAAHASGEIEAVILRPGDVYGPAARVWVDMLLAMCQTDSLTLPDKGRGMFAPLYIDDLVAAVELAVNVPDAAGHIFTITGDEWLPAASFIASHRRWAGRKGAPPSLPFAAALAAAERGQDPEGPDMVRLFARSGRFSIDKARSILGFTPNTSFAEGMALCEAHLLATGAISAPLSDAFSEGSLA